MLFHEFGAQDAPPVLLMHGMMQDWRSFYALLKPLEAHYRLILPAMDGFYDHSPTFTSFADQARQIEEYVSEKHGGKLHGAYGVSQGGLMLTELLSRNRIAIKSHNILKKYLKNYREEIIDGLGHGEFLLKDPAGLCRKIVDTLGPA